MAPNSSPQTSSKKIIHINLKLTMHGVIQFGIVKTLYFRSLEAVVRLGQTAKFDQPNVFSTAKLNFSMEPFTTCNCR